MRRSGVGVWIVTVRAAAAALIALAAMLAFGGAAGAHGGASVSALIAKTTPTLDGVFSPDEWTNDAGTLSIFPGTVHEGTLYVKHDASTLYVALVIKDSPPSPSGNCCPATFYFDNKHDGVRDAKDDAVNVTAGSGSNSKNDLYWTGTAYEEDRKDGGSADIEGRAAYDKATQSMVIELRHPLCSNDHDHDICVTVGKTLGVTLDYYAAPGSYLGGYPAAPSDAARFADLLIEPVTPPDTTPPTVTLTEPAADVGVAKGTAVPLAATATDTGSGVKLVRFDVSADGGLNFKEISSDMDPPYTASLDTATLNEGNYLVRAVAVDKLDNSATSATRTVSVTTTPVAVTGVTVTTDKTTVEAGAKQIEISKIPLTSIPVGSGTTDSAPLASIPLASIPLASIPLASIPLASIPLASIGLTPAILDTYVGGLPLSSVPLVAPDSWSSRLAGTALAGVPEQTLTLARVLDLNPSPASSPTPVRLVDVAVADSPLASIPLASIALGQLLLKDVPIKGSAATALADWCSAFAAAGYPCTDPNSLAGTTIMAATIAGAPLASIPLASIPLASIPLASIPLASIPLASIVAASTPLASIPLASIGAAARALIVDCGTYACASKTLGNAAQEGALKPGVTLGAVASGLPPEVTVGVILAAISGQSASWESLPFATMGAQGFATDASRVSESVSFRLSGATVAVQAPVTVTLTAGIPPGALYIKGTAQLVTLGTGGTTVSLPDPTQTGKTLKLTIPAVRRGADYRIDLKLGPSLTIGAAGPLTASVAAGAGAGVDATPADAGTVTDTFEPNDEPASALVLAEGSVYTSYLTSAHDVDLYRFAVPSAEGGRVTVHLTTPGKDYDLVVYRPGPLALRSSPLASIPLDGVPVGDDGVGVAHALDPLQPDTLQDVPLRAGLTVGAISANRGSAAESAQLEIRRGETGFYTIQVSGENGVFDNGYYALRVEVQKPPAQPACTPRSFTNAPGTPAAAPSVSALPAQLNTVFVVNRDQLQRTYGDAAAQSVMTALTSLAGRSDLGVVGAVLPVDNATATPMTSWDAAPCSSTLANAAAGAVNAAVEAVRAARPSLKYVVLVGGDDQIPFFRTPDLTTLSNESEYASTLAGPNNEYLGSSLSGDLLTDNPYGTPAPIPFLDRFLYLPTLAVGRLVETPDDIVKQAQTFQSFGGRLDPTSAQVTGYDFLSDGATAVGNALVPTLGASAVKRLIGDTWTLADLQGAVAAPTAGLLSLNAHYDHFRALPADQNAAGQASQLFTSSMLAGSALSRSYAFSMGCHAGYSLSDIVIGASDARRLDWPQVFGAGSAVYAANTGFGYGDTAAVAYSERLMVNLAKRLDGSLTAGEALLYALNDYAGSVGGLLGAYDEKVISQATFFGLPMYRIGAGTALPPLPTPPATTTDPLTGLTISQLSVTPTQTLKTTTRGSYYAGENGGTSVLNYRPIQPLTDLDVAHPSLVAHGALITGLTSVDQNGFNPVFSTPTVDLSAREPEATFRDAVHPARIQSIATFADPRGPRQHLSLVTGQFASNTTGPVDVGRERLFTKIQAEVEYAAPGVTDFTPPEFGRISGAQIGDQAAFSVEATDAGGVKRVVVGYHDGAVWKFVDLRPDGDVWTGGGPVSTPGAEFFVQAVDAAGNVGVAVFKGRYYLVAVPPPIPAGIVIGLTGTEGDAGWFTSPVDVAVSGAAAPFFTSVDGSAFGSDTAFGLTHDGIHTIDVQGAGGVTARKIVAIDATAPTIVVTSPTDGASLPQGAPQTAAFSCVDRGSGIVSCVGSIANGGPLTGTFGPQTLTVTARDAAGNTAQKTVTFAVAWPFAGFFRPVDNPPKVNNANAGQAIPIKFSLGGNRGLAIIASGYPQAQQETCPTGATSTVDETATSGASGLSYSAGSDRYTYVWKTDKKWAGSCRKFVLKLVDGSTHTADFKFK